MRLRRVLLPAVLAVTAVATGAAAGLQEQAARSAPEALGGPVAATPVLSVRRLPTVVAEPVADRRLRADLAEWATSAPGPASCATVVDPDGETVLVHHPDERLVPASTAKLLTAAAAAARLGPAHRFRTVVRAAPPVDGTISGDLHLVGGGDPLLATAAYAGRFPRQPQVHTDLGTLADAIRAAGVQRVDGAVVGDESHYDTARSVEGWPARYLDQKVIGPLSALTVNDGFARYPGDGGPDLDPAEDPAAHAAAVLTTLLEERGVVVTGPARSGPAPDVPELAAVDSPPLPEVLRQLLQESDNLTAELLVKELGTTVGSPSTVGGLAAVTAALAELGLDTEGLDLRDGSGLSPDSRVTCDILVDALAHPAVGEVLRAGLAVAGVSGTLAEAFEGTSLEGALAAKTGSLNAVASLAGTVTDDDGSFTFAFLANDPDGRIDEEPVRAAQSALGQLLLGWPRVPDVGALGPLPPRGA